MGLLSDSVRNRREKMIAYILASCLPKHQLKEKEYYEELHLAMLEEEYRLVKQYQQSRIEKRSR